jgi:phenylacetate-CoA ligase
MLTDIINKICGNALVFSKLPGQRGVPYLPRAKLHALRDARLREMVRYAAKTVPYYLNLFRREKIDPGEIRTVEDLDRLPFIDKEVVRKNPHYFVSASRRGKKSIPFTTSGTTGMPLTIYHDQHSLLFNIAFGEREREVQSKICDRKLGHREVVIFYPGNTSSKVWDFYRRMTFIPVRPERLVLSVLQPIEQIVQSINRFRPNVIRSYGSYLETLFRILAQREIQMHLPRMLIYGADTMTEGGKSFIEEKFGVPVFSLYNAVEAFKIGFSCEQRQNFHLHDDLCHVMIIDKSGEKTANGKKGEVVISNLVNHGTVLLNYRLGDIASISMEKCSCGRTLALLSEFEGRVEDVIFLPNGEFVHPRAVWKIFKFRNEVLQYQLIQHEPERFELSIVTADRDIYHRVIDDILADLRHLLGKSATIESEYQQELERQKGGKFRPVISLCTPEGFK